MNNKINTFSEYKELLLTCFGEYEEQLSKQLSLINIENHEYNRNYIEPINAKLEELNQFVNNKLEELNQFSKNNQNFNDLLKSLFENFLVEDWNNKLKLIFLKELILETKIAELNRDSNNYSLLFRAIWNMDKEYLGTENPDDDIEIITLLLENGANPNTILLNNLNHYQTPLEFASSFVNSWYKIKIMDLLIKYDANPNIYIYQGKWYTGLYDMSFNNKINISCFPIGNHKQKLL